MATLSKLPIVIAIALKVVERILQIVERKKTSKRLGNEKKK